MARIAAGVLPASPLASRGYRTGRFTQKMGRRHTKGRGAKSFGFLTSKGAFVLTKAPEYHVPDMSACKLKPYVSYDTQTRLATDPKAP
ncbi:hypothetical protein KFE25_006807 [Diacronema lutheri]|uniref:Mitochondrial ribosomal protein L27 n=2 Tax=Diacronema lutheri TaxID=2081491 RepID=A0A8J5XYE4_DIALT|nr:hypothetical protein KFE25_006807 [Diacronema lutheri]